MTARPPSRRRPSRLMFAVLCAFAVVTAGCSSTTQRNLDVAAAGPATASDTGAALPSSDAFAVDSALPVPDTARPSASGRSDGSAAVAPTGMDPTKIPTRSQGVTDTTISIGVPVLVNYDTVVNSFAAKGQTVGDQRAQAQAVVDYLNARGGMAGRQIKPVYQEWDSSNGTFASQAQSTCVGLTQDHHVFAVANHTYGMATLVDCLARANTPLVAGGDTGGWADQAMLDQNDQFLYMPASLNFTRWAVLVDGLVDAGFFGGRFRDLRG